jgi:ribonuclease E
MSADKDPWADLAESLGAASGQEPTRPQQPAPTPPRQPPRATTKPARPAPAGGGDWGSLAADLGLEAAQESPARSEARPARTVPSPAVEPAASRDRDESVAGERAEHPVRHDGAERGPRGGRDEDDAGGEGRGRRRRGRRGGRGRGRRDDDRSEARDRPPQRESTPAADAWERSASAPRADDDRPSFADEIVTTDAGGARDRGGSAGPESRDDEDRPRRRRRGRRGGRRRGRGDRERTTDERAASAESAQPRGDGDIDDEPLPTGYGVAARQQPTARGDESRPAESETGERRGRRRRRRGGERRTSEGGREAAGSGPRESSRQSRRRGEGSRSASRPARSRRDDFAPVAGRFEEDDEGLEFLGVEEAIRAEASTRERRPHVEDEVLAESGLDTVREVPSWVEAIGIVIASNLDARGKSGQRK